MARPSLRLPEQARARPAGNPDVAVPKTVTLPELRRINQSRGLAGTAAADGQIDLLPVWEIKLHRPKMAAG